MECLIVNIKGFLQGELLEKCICDSGLEDKIELITHVVEKKYMQDVLETVSYFGTFSGICLKSEFLKEIGEMCQFSFIPGYFSYNVEDKLPDNLVGIRISEESIYLKYFHVYLLLLSVGDEEVTISIFPQEIKLEIFKHVQNLIIQEIEELKNRGADVISIAPKNNPHGAQSSCVI